MKSDFLLAITQLAAEKNLPKEVVLGAVEAALVSAYRKDNFAPNQELTVKMDPVNGRVRVWAEKEVVEKPTDRRTEVTLEHAKQVKPDAELGEMVMIEDTPANAGRIATRLRTAPSSSSSPVKRETSSAAWCSALSRARSSSTWGVPRPLCRPPSRCSRSATAPASASSSTW